jgi:bifunctional DNA-binding transcriptional regulator/antitoxin component of YhaV-PrlF toxin-antitoxin module
MKKISATIGNNGELVLPVEVLDHLGLVQGEAILIVLGEDGSVQLRHNKSMPVAALRGRAGKLDHALTWEEMRQIAREDYLEAMQLSE